MPLARRFGISLAPLRQRRSQTAATGRSTTAPATVTDRRYRNHHCASDGHRPPLQALSGFSGGLLLRFADRPDHVQGAFQIVLEFIPQNPLAAIQSVGELDQLAGVSGELFGGEKRLVDWSGSMAGNSPSLARFRDSMIDADRCENVSMSSSTSRCSSSRKYSAMVNTAWPTRKRAPGGSNRLACLLPLASPDHVGEFTLV